MVECKESCRCDFCFISKGIKACKNSFCGSLIYRGQSSWTRGYCSYECVLEVRHFESMTTGKLLTA